MGVHAHSGSSSNSAASGRRKPGTRSPPSRSWPSCKDLNLRRRRVDVDFLLARVDDPDPAHTGLEVLVDLFVHLVGRCSMG